MAIISSRQTETMSDEAAEASGSDSSLMEGLSSAGAHTPPEAVSLWLGVQTGDRFAGAQFASGSLNTHDESAPGPGHTRQDLGRSPMGSYSPLAFRVPSSTPR